MLTQKAQVLKDSLEGWLGRLGLEEVEAEFWSPEDRDGYAELLVMTFDGDVHDILWAPAEGESADSSLLREFQDIVKSQGFSIHRKNYTTMYFTA